ncbi:hypothetical protein [Burkholderia cenocepacia]|uniref:hypothetical protein n=1 Tax=Burkholderia cenocepacia TaxID=95486 RepID=UPI00163A4971|nr:hypothetical protein [Burkholderia cenocepacia]
MMGTTLRSVFIAVYDGRREALTNLQPQLVSVLASSFEHPACRLFEICSEFGFVYVTEMLERISDAIQLVGGRFAIPWRVTIEAAIAGDLQATPSHLFAKNLFG